MLHRRLLHRSHQTRSKPLRHPTQPAQFRHLAQSRIDRTPHHLGPLACLRCNHIRQIQLRRNLPLLRKLNRPGKVARPHMPSPPLQTRLLRKPNINPCINLSLQLQIKLIQKLFLRRKVGKQRARRNPGPLRNAGRRRPKPTLSDLTHRRIKDRPTLFRTLNPRHSSNETTSSRPDLYLSEFSTEIFQDGGMFSSPRKHHTNHHVLPPKTHNFTTNNHQFPPIFRKTPRKNQPKKITVLHAAEPPAAPATPPLKSFPAPPARHTEPGGTPSLAPPSHTQQTPPASRNPSAAPPPPD